MKGTIVILGCLLAAYAAPLFANEVPLILEETVNMTVATQIWDAVPTLDGDVWWVAAYNSLESDTAYRTTVYSGSADANGLDSLSGIWGEVLSVVTYINDTGIPSCIVSTNAATEYSLGESSGVSYQDTTWLHYLSLNNLQELREPSMVFGEVYRQYFRPPNPAWVEYTDGLVRGNVSKLECVPGAPYPTESCIALISMTESHGSASPGESGSSAAYSGKLLSAPLLFDSSSLAAGDTFGYGYALDIARSDVDVFSVALRASMNWQMSGGYSTWTSWRVVFQRLLADSAETIHTTGRLRNFWPTAIWPERIAAVTYDAAHNRALAMYVWYNASNTYEMVCVSSANPSEPVRRSCTYYDGVGAAAVFPDTVAEQFVVRHQNRLEYFSFANCELLAESPIDPGASEIKIIGRYYDDFRRLVVRYGSELRIYRFGEPILDADDARPELPNELSLLAYPNPFNPTAMIAFDLPKAGRAKLVVYDLNGRLVQTLFDEQMSAGHHEVGFDGANLPSGIYFARLSAGDLTRTHKLVLMK